MDKRASSTQAISGLVSARDGAAVALVALALSFVLSRELNPIWAGAGPPIFTIGITAVGWPASSIARFRGHHGVLRAVTWGASLAAPFSFLTLVTGSLVEAMSMLGLGFLAGISAWLVVKVQVLAARPFADRYQCGVGYTVAALISAGVLALLAQSLTPGDQQSARTVAAVEIPLHTSTDRADFLALLRRHARAGNLHVDDGTAEWIEFRRGSHPDEPPSVTAMLSKTIDISIWRGEEDNELEATVDDGGHNGRPWLMFLRGAHPEVATQFRARLLTEIQARWPEVRNIPVTPDGGLPLSEDLVWTGKSYEIKRERAASYSDGAAEHGVSAQSPTVGNGS